MHPRIGDHIGAVLAVGAGGAAGTWYTAFISPAISFTIGMLTIAYLAPRAVDAWPRWAAWIRKLRGKE